MGSLTTGWRPAETATGVGGVGGVLLPKVPEEAVLKCGTQGWNRFRATTPHQ